MLRQLTASCLRQRCRTVWVPSRSCADGNSDGTDASHATEADRAYVVSNLPTGLDATTIYGNYFTSGEYKPREIEKHVVAAVDVIDPNNVEQAFLSLRRRYREEGFEKIWRTRRHTRRCLEKRQAQRDADYRAYKREIGERMKWIRRFRGRGF